MTKKKQYEQVGVAMTCRSFEEYGRMFDLTEIDLSKGSILDVAGGSSSFVAEARKRGYDAYAVDPRYEGDMGNWIAEAAAEIDTSTAKLAGIRESFDWSYYGSLENHRAGRERSLRQFAEHVREADSGRSYRAGKLPALPFEDGAFSMVLCSHFLFLYAEQFGDSFHREAIKELIRICKPGGQIRIYPLLSLRWEPYPQLEELMKHIRSCQGEPVLQPSKLPFIPASTSYLRINRLNHS